MAVRNDKVVHIRQRPGEPGIQMDAVVKKRIDWFSRGRLAYGKITICDGDPGLGKSTMLMDMAASVSRGEPFAPGDPPPKKRGVVIICLEDDPADTIRPRLEVANADLSEIYLIDEMPVYHPDTHELIPDKTRLFELPGDAGLLENVCLERNVGLVIIDPLIGFMEDGLNDNSGRDIRKAIQPLLKAMQRVGACCVMLRHLNKGQSSNSLYRGAGSVQIGALARLVMLVAKHPDNPKQRVLAMTKSNLGDDVPSLIFSLDSVEDEDVARITWHGTTEMTSDELLNNALLTEEQRAEKDDAATLMLSELQSGPKTENQLRKAFVANSLTPTALKKTKTRLRANHQVSCARIGGVGDTDAFWIWHLPGVDPKEFLFNEPWKTAKQVSLLSPDREWER